MTGETIFIDFGANIGAIALYAAQNASRVICFEPDPISHSMLVANIHANPEIAHKIRVIPKAVHPRGGLIRFGSENSGGDSMSSNILPGLGTAWPIESLTPDEVNSMLPVTHAPIFVKMDIEGGEYDVIPAAKAL